MSGPANRKRARLDSDSTSDDGEAANAGRDEAAAHNDEEFWYEDGTIILIAREIEFRVYKGLLAERSPLFKDMLSLPQPPQSSYDSAPCPVVHLSDSPEDLRHLLRVCMPKESSR